MSEEEKKAIETLKLYIQRKKSTHTTYNTEDIILDNVIILLSLYVKQQKEIEELKKPKYIVNFENNEIKKNNRN